MTAKTQASAKAERGIRSSEEHAGKEWQDQAVAAARLFVRWHERRGKIWFTVEELRLWCQPRIDAAPDLRCWGAATRRLKAENVIEATGFYAPANSSNRSPKPLYRRA